MTDISVRDMTEADLALLFEIQADPAGQRMAAFADTSGDREKFLTRRRERLADGSVQQKVIVVDGDVVGDVASFVFQGETTVAYWTRRDYWGRGITTRALAVFLGEVTVRPLYARTAHDNAGSIRVLERNGFVRAGEEESFAEARHEKIKEFIFRLD